MLTNIIAMGDNHGHLACDDTLDAIMEGVARYKPKGGNRQYRVHLGDNWDMTCLRKGIEHNSKEAIDNLREDLDAGIQWIRRYKPTHFLFGNHEWRVFELLHNTDSMSKARKAQDVIDEMKRELRAVGCKVIKPYDVRDCRVSIEGIDFIHGMSHGKNALLQDQATYGTPGHGFAMGHLHREEQLNYQHIEGGAAFLCGCAMDISLANYALRRSGTLRWQNGFLRFVTDGTKYKGYQIHRWDSKHWVFDGELWSSGRKRK
jgi:hypothetical protein